jgi:tetratricopeptide (TPR) repeat protein
MLLNAFLGCVIFLITNLSLLYAAHLFIRRFFSHATNAVRLVATGLLFYSLIILLFQLLSPVHAISKSGVTLSCFLLALLLHFTWGKYRNIQADLEPIRSWLREAFSSRWALLLTICGFVVLLSLSRALLMPPFGVDCLSYHLTFAALWMKKGTLALFKAPDVITMARHYPINGEILASWLLLPFHNDLVVNTMNFPILVLGGISCYAIARELGLTRKAASFVPALICFAPVLYAQITTQYVDTAVFTFSVIAALFTFRYLRSGSLIDSLLAFIAAGMLLGTKYTAIPLVGIIVIASIVKTISLVNKAPFLRKVLWAIVGLLIICTFGGRQYMHNMIEARNPLFPLSVTVFNHELIEGWPKLEQFRELMQEYDKEHGLDKFNWWEKEYRKFFYLSTTAGPKFFLFFILAVFSLFTRPGDIPRKSWFLLTVLWIVPIVLFYTNPSTEFNRTGFFSVGSIRFLTPSLAFMTIQALVVMYRQSNYFIKKDFFLALLIMWDILHAYKYFIWDGWEAAIVYPFFVLLAPLLLLVFNRFFRKVTKVDEKKESFVIPAGLSRLRTTTTKRWMIYSVGFISLVAGVYFLQAYRDTTRYEQYVNQSSFSSFPERFVNAWEYLDKPDGKKTIAMTTGWPGQWFFYPLLGKSLQNDVVYLSAKNKEEVPTWFDQGLLRGNNLFIWLHNLRAKKVDFIFVAKPWPRELQWIQRYQENFQLVFADEKCRIFKLIKKSTLDPIISHFDSVVSAYKKELDIKPNDLKVRQKLAAFYLEQGMFDEGISEFSKIVTMNPNQAKAHSNLGGAYTQSGRLDEAITSYTKVLTLEPNSVKAHYHLGRTYDKKGNIDEAIAEYKKALIINPAYADAHFKLGLDYYKKDMLDKSISALENVLSIVPDHSMAHTNLSIAYYYKKNYELAIVHCDRSRELGGKVSAELLSALRPYR